MVVGNKAQKIPKTALKTSVFSFCQLLVQKGFQPDGREASLPVLFMHDLSVTFQIQAYFNLVPILGTVYFRPPIDILQDTDLVCHSPVTELAPCHTATHQLQGRTSLLALLGTSGQRPARRPCSTFRPPDKVLGFIPHLLAHTYALSGKEWAFPACQPLAEMTMPQQHVGQR